MWDVAGSTCLLTDVTMLKLWCVLSLLVSVIGVGLAKPWDQNCIEDAVGFGLETTGGSKGETVQPSTNEELVEALCDSVSEDGEQCEDDIPRTIILDGTFSFSSDDEETVLGCRYEDCSPGSASNSQFALDKDGMCDGKAPAMFTIDKAGQQPLLVGSHKSIIGLPGAGISGKGLKLVDVRNVIIQGIVIENINPHAVGAGDAIYMADVENVWIHKNVIKSVGSHMIVADKWGENRGVTVSSNLFDGRSADSATCDGNHKWMWLVSGREDSVTFVNNRVLNASGRSPLVVGANNFAHVIGNTFEGGSRDAISAADGASILAEGNTFVDVKDVVKTEDASFGSVFLPRDQEEANQCLEDLDRPCQVNNLVNSGVGDDVRADSWVLQRCGELDLHQKLGVAKAAASIYQCNA